MYLDRYYVYIVYTSHTTLVQYMFIFLTHILLGPEYKSRTFIPKEIIFFQSKTLSGSTCLFEKTVAIWRHLFGPTHLIGGGQDAFFCNVKSANQ